MRASTRRASRTSSRRCARPASTRRRELVPVAPAAPLRDGRVVTDLDGRTARRRPLRGRRVRLHRPARRQPARLQLALGVLRVRPPRRARRRSTSRPPPRAGARRARRRSSRRPTRDPRGRVARRRASSATPTASTALLDDPHPLARLVAASALAREETRGAHLAARLSRTPIPASTGTTPSSRRETRTSSHEAWDVTRSRLTRTQHSPRSELHKAGAICRIRGPRSRAGRPGGTQPCTNSAAPSTGSWRRTSSTTRSPRRAGRPTTSACCAPARPRSTAWRRIATTSRRPSQDAVPRHPHLLPDVRRRTASTASSTAT